MTNFHILTIFPEMFESCLGASICKRALEAEHIAVSLHNFRDYTLDKHRRVDEAPFGGGAGKLIAPQSVFDCFEAIEQTQQGKKKINLYMSPAGKVLDQKLAAELAEYEEINILCGHYEGVDQRILDAKIDEEISIGDYVLTGGELPAMVLMDCVMRQVLLSGHHANILAWQRKKAIEKTANNRPDLLEKARLTPEERRALAEGKMDDEL